jgi:hypothetical protein
MANNSQQQIDQLKALKERLQNQEAKQKQRLAEISEKLRAVTLTISLLGEERENEDTSPGVSVRELQGMKQVEALVYIAKHNNGRVRIVDAKKLFTKAGVMKVTKNSYGILYTVIQRSGKFKHSGRGEYELLPEEASTEENAQVLLMRTRSAS